MPIGSFILSSKSLSRLNANRNALNFFFEEYTHFKIKKVMNGVEKEIFLETSTVKDAIRNCTAEDQALPLPLKAYENCEITFNMSLSKKVLPVYRKRPFAHYLDSLSWYDEDEVEKFQKNDVGNFPLKVLNRSKRTWTEETVDAFMRNNTCFSFNNALHLKKENAFVFFKKGQLYFLRYGDCPILTKLNVRVDFEKAVVTISRLEELKTNKHNKSELKIIQTAKEFFQKAFFSPERHAHRNYSLADIKKIQRGFNRNILHNVLGLLRYYPVDKLPKKSPLYALFNKKLHNKIDNRLYQHILTILAFCKNSPENADFSDALKRVMAEDFLNASHHMGNAKEAIGVREAVENLFKAMQEKSAKEYIAIGKKVEKESLPMTLKEKLISGLGALALIAAFISLMILMTASLAVGLPFVITLCVVTFAIAITCFIAICKLFNSAEAQDFNSYASGFNFFFTKLNEDKKSLEAEQLLSNITLYQESLPDKNIENDVRVI